MNFNTYKGYSDNIKNNDYNYEINSMFYAEYMKNLISIITSDLKQHNINYNNIKIDFVVDVLQNDIVRLKPSIKIYNNDLEVKINSLFVSYKLLNNDNCNFFIDKLNEYVNNNYISYNYFIEYMNKLGFDTNYSDINSLCNDMNILNTNKITVLELNKSKVKKYSSN